MAKEKSKNISKIKQGKANRAAGARFELKVRDDLEKIGFIVDKWSNNVEFTQNYTEVGSCGILWDSRVVKRIPTTKEGECVKVKNMFLGPGKPMMLGAGFPDFIAYRYCVHPFSKDDSYKVIFVEAKSNGILDKIEKEKAKWYLENNYCSEFLIAYKEKVGRKIIVKYKEFK